MADFLKNIIGGKSSESAVPSADSDFADFAEAPSPTPAAFTPVAGGADFSGALPTARPYTKWYNLHERYTLADFQAEGLILIAIVVILTLHVVGTRLNRAKARAWAKAHARLLTDEFAVVGFGSQSPSASDAEKILKEKSLFEFATYATGRQNVAFVDVKLNLIKRFNPLMTLGEAALGFASDSFTSPQEYMEATLYPFDGKEGQIVPGIPGAAELKAKDSKSAFDGFVWAVVNKDKMKNVREDRYDISITFTKDNSKLPNWLTVMSESAEITELLLTPEVVSAVEKAGDLFESLIITDQPVVKPTKISETVSRKRLYLKYKIPGNNNYDNLVPLFTAFVRMSDHLASSAHLRPEVLRKVKSVRDETIRQIQKVAEDEKNEERTIEREKAKKAKRDAELNALDAKGQKKYLDKEKDKMMRKANKRQTTRA